MHLHLIHLTCHLHISKKNYSPLFYYTTPHTLPFSCSIIHPAPRSHSLHPPLPQNYPTLHTQLPTPLYQYTQSLILPTIVKILRSPPHKPLFKHLLYPHTPPHPRYTFPTPSLFRCVHAPSDTHLFLFADSRHQWLNPSTFCFMAPRTSPATSAKASTRRLQSATTF